MTVWYTAPIGSLVEMESCWGNETKTGRLEAADHEANRYVVVCAGQRMTFDRMGREHFEDGAVLMDGLSPSRVLRLGP